MEGAAVDECELLGRGADGQEHATLRAAVFRLFPPDEFVVGPLTIRKDLGRFLGEEVPDKLQFLSSACTMLAAAIPEDSLYGKMLRSGADQPERWYRIPISQLNAVQALTLLMARVLLGSLMNGADARAKEAALTDAVLLVLDAVTKVDSAVFYTAPDQPPPSGGPRDPVLWVPSVVVELGRTGGIDTNLAHKLGGLMAKSIRRISSTAETVRQKLNTRRATTGGAGKKSARAPARVRRSTAGGPSGCLL